MLIKSFPWSQVIVTACKMNAASVAVIRSEALSVFLRAFTLAELYLNANYNAARYHFIFLLADKLAGEMKKG